MSSRATLEITEEQRKELMGISQSRGAAGGLVRRAKLTLLLSEGMPYSGIAWRLEISKPTIVRWKERFQSEVCMDATRVITPAQNPVNARLRCRPKFCRLLARTQRMARRSQNSISSAWMKKRPFRFWTGSVRCCRSPPAGPSAMASSPTGTARFLGNPVVFESRYPAGGRRS
jgi:hypothetical protein